MSRATRDKKKHGIYAVPLSRILSNAEAEYHT